MKKFIAAVVSAALALSCFAGCGAKPAVSQTPAQPASSAAEVTPEAASEPEKEPAVIKVTDHAGREVELPYKIDRVVVTDIYPLASILTVFLGSAERIVGIHPMSMSAAANGTLGELFPEILNADTSFMQGTDLNVESLMALQPDVVFCNAANKDEIQALTGAGIPCVGVAAGKWQFNILETYSQWIALLSQIFPEEAKEEQVREYSEAVYKEVQQAVSSVAEADKQKILFLYSYDDSSMVTSSSKFFGQFWAEAVGGINVAQDVPAETSNAVITMEQVYEWNPDVIFITNFTKCQPDDLYTGTINGDDWSSVQAVKDQRVYKLPLGTYRTYTPSTDTPVTLLWMAQKTYPELFADLDIAQRVVEYYSDMYGVQLTDQQVQAMFEPSAAAAMH